MAEVQNIVAGANKKVELLSKENEELNERCEELWTQIRSTNQASNSQQKDHDSLLSENKALRGCLCKNRAPSSGRKYESLQIFHNNFPFRYLYEKRNRFALKIFFCKIWPIDILHLDGSKMAA